jgi:hypothetical protein
MAIGNNSIGIGIILKGFDQGLTGLAGRVSQQGRDLCFLCSFKSAINDTSACGIVRKMKILQSCNLSADAIL